LKIVQQTIIKEKMVKQFFNKLKASYKSQNEEEEDDEMGDIIDMPKRSYGGGRRHSVAAEKYNPEEDTSEEPDVVNPKSNEEREYLIKTLADIFIFRSLEQKQMDRVIDAMFGRAVTCGDVIIEQGRILGNKNF
jgi:cAMP-dependent protein kinase regulator